MGLCHGNHGCRSVLLCPLTRPNSLLQLRLVRRCYGVKRFLNELGHKHNRYMVYHDSQNAIQLRKNVSFHSMSKHINMIYHWVKDVLKNKSFELTKIHTNKNLSDMMTKVVTKAKYLFCRSRASMVGTSHVG